MPTSSALWPRASREATLLAGRRSAAPIFRRPTRSGRRPFPISPRLYLVYLASSPALISGKLASPYIWQAGRARSSSAPSTFGAGSILQVRPFYLHTSSAERCLFTRRLSSCGRPSETVARTAQTRRPKQIGQFVDTPPFSLPRTHLGHAPSYAPAKGAWPRCHLSPRD